MLTAKCPGQDRRNWKPGDIFDHPCPNCEEMVEFWKTDAKVTCPSCKTEIINPKLNLGCALWCDYAEQCVGDISDVFNEQPEALRDKLELESRRYFIGEKGRWEFTRESAEVASKVLELEKEATPPVVLAVIFLNDIGYALCKKKGQELTSENIAECAQEGAKEILKKIKLPNEVQEKALKILNVVVQNSEDDLEGENQLLEAGDIDCLLCRDILQITRFKRYTVKAGGTEEEKEQLTNKLNRNSSVKYVTNILNL